MDLTSETSLVRLRARAIGIARKSRMGWVGEDFASWATIKRLEGRESALRYLWIDFLRTTYGAKTPGEYSARISMEIAQFRIDALGAVEGYKKLPRELWHFDASPFELKDFLNFKNPRLKAIAQLLYLEDRDLRQIAKVMGVSEQRIGQLVREIEMEIRKRHNEEP